jgi:Holliday junction resolvase RusA-like endonuclease
MNTILLNIHEEKLLQLRNLFPPSLNEYISMIRMAQNTLKTKYKEFSIWLAEYYEINNLNLDNAIITYTFYFKTHIRHDFDNLMLTPKLVNDGLVDAGVFKDDCGEFLKLEFNPFKYDKSNPRVEMLLEY